MANTTSLNSLVLKFHDVDKTKLDIVGGKGANLGELGRIEGINVPDGFCISTEAFNGIIAATPTISKLIDELALVTVDKWDRIAELSSEIRRAIVEATIPQHISAEITRNISGLDEKNAVAVRSSATAEDLATASFAGQQDTYLNIIGKESILTYISKCWASLYTERAVMYRIQNGFDHRKVSLSVVVQQMVFPQVAGILFTADPLTSNRKVLSIDASFGLGEALVSGLVNADNYKVVKEKIIDKKISAKKLAIYASKDGGTKEEAIEPAKQDSQALTDEQIVKLEQLGRKIEEHFGCPQDIEWCLVDNTFYIVQSRPITTLYPVPDANDQENHVYVSVAHQQMMTDPIKPLGLSFFLLTTKAPMYKAGGRLFVDVTKNLSSPGSRKTIIDMFGKSHPLIKDAFLTIAARKDFLKSPRVDKEDPGQNNDLKAQPAFGPLPQVEDDPAIVSDFVKRSQSSLAELKENIQTKSGLALFDFITEHMQYSKTVLFDARSLSVIMAAMDASLWINEKMDEWLGEKNASDTLTQSVPNNITSQMGLALLDVADVIRPYPDVIDYLQHVKDDNFLNELHRFNGGQETCDALRDYLDKYGMRCAGEIDITNTRWSENPTALVPIILTNIKTFEPNASKHKFEQGLQEASKKEQELLMKLKQLPGGEGKVEETKKMIRRVRIFSGYREYPKYALVNRYFVYKQALLKEADQLVLAKIIQKKEDIYYLSFEELREVVRTNKLDYQVIGKRKEEYKFFEKLTPPSVITSDGEIITGKYKREHLPAKAIAGTAVSSGIIEGRARVILKMEKADLEDGDILVTSFTDPSWTPLFLAIKGLVTEVGGLMTHGAVIAREYGLPAVVGIDNATKLITDGQRIRVNGTEGYVEIL